MNHFATSVDRLDAELGSGDALTDAANRKLLREALKRWQRGLTRAVAESHETVKEPD